MRQVVKAAKYAVMDASVDHGVSEGINAEFFTSSLQSLAYIESDIRTLINSALEKIPSSSMTAQTIRLVIDCYDKGILYSEAREKAYLNRLSAKELIGRSPYSYDIAHCRQFSVRVEMDKHPRVIVGDKRRISVTFIAIHDINETRRLSLRLLLPSGWSAEGLNRSLLLEYPQPVYNLYGIAKTEFTITIGENIAPTNYAYVEVTSPSMIYPTLISIVFIG